MSPFWKMEHLHHPHLRYNHSLSFNLLYFFHNISYSLNYITHKQWSCHKNYSVYCGSLLVECWLWFSMLPKWTSRKVLPLLEEVGIFPGLTYPVRSILSWGIQQTHPVSLTRVTAGTQRRQSHKSSASPCLLHAEGFICVTQENLTNDGKKPRLSGGQWLPDSGGRKGILQRQCECRAPYVSDVPGAG